MTGGVAPGVATRSACRVLVAAVAAPSVIDARVIALGPVEANERESVITPTTTGPEVVVGSAAETVPAPAAVVPAAVADVGAADAGLTDAAGAADDEELCAIAPAMREDKPKVVLKIDRIVD